MANIVRLTNLTQTANNTSAITVEDFGDTLFVGPNATIAASGIVGAAIFLSEGGNALVIRGTLYSATSSAIAQNGYGAFGGSRVEIGEGAFAFGANYGVQLGNDGNEVFNAGEIVANAWDGIRAPGADSVVVNLGTVRAQSQGVDVGVDANITNTGEILGGQDGIAMGARGLLRNEGLIAGVEAGGTGLRATGDDMTIHNHGRIAAFEAPAIRIEDGTGLGFNTILNTGTIEAVASALSVVTGDAIDHFENAGLVIGGISLGGGTDYYDGRLGQVLRGVVDGGEGEDTLLGGDSHDRFAGGAGDDEIVGGAGDDIIEGGAGGDILVGSEGFDMLLYSRSQSGVSVNLANGLAGGGEAEGDIISGFEAVRGSAFNDTLVGSTEDNWLIGANGNDILDGGAGNDRLLGGAGDDVIIGGRGADVLIGGEGADTFTFGNIADSTVNPAGRDRIRDFDALEGDIIDLARIDADMNTAGNQAFSFIGFAAFTGTAGELRMQTNNGHLLVTADVDGDARADFALLLRNVVTLAETDFVL